MWWDAMVDSRAARSRETVTAVLRLPWSRRRRGGAPEPCPPRRRMVADSRTTPAVGTVTADTPLSASPRSAVPDRHDFHGWRDDGRDAPSVPSPRPAGHRGSRGPGAPVENAAKPAAAGLAVGHADGRARAFDAWLDQPPHHRLRPGRSPRPPSSGTRFLAAASWRPSAPSHGSRTVRPQARHGCASDFDCCMPVPAVPDRLEASSTAFSTRSRARSTSRFSTEATAASIHAPNISGTTAISPHTIT